LGGKKSDLVTCLEKSDCDLAEEAEAVVSIDKTDEDDVEYVVKGSGEHVALDDGSAESREQQSTADILELGNGRKLIDATNQESYDQVHVCMKDDPCCSTDAFTKHMLTFLFFTGFRI
jgi:cephalosporin-C deacetylase-like acetyl esterase